MKRNKLILLATSVTLVSCISILSRYSGTGEWPTLKEMELKGEDGEEGEAEHGIQGAIESFYSMRLNEATGTLEPEWIYQAIAQADKLKVSSRATKPILWTNMGPDNVGGRIRAFLMHRDSANLMFAGGVSGGLFRSNTTGQSWTPVNDMEENLNVNCIAQTPDGTIYYGTGEGGFTNGLTKGGGTRNGSPGFVGIGVFKSTNPSGTDYTNIVNTKTWTACNAMVAHPTENWLWVATETGLMRTVNGGANWSVVRGGAIKDLAIDKNGIVWCSNSSGTVYKGNTDGTVFTATNTGIASGGRTAIAVSPQDPQYIYLMGAAANSSFSGVWRSTNGGTNWDLIVGNSSVTNVFGGNNQGYYDNVVAVDPLDKDKIYLGGVVLASWDSDNGYREIASLLDAPWNSSYVHADKHVIQFNMRTTPPTMIVGCDGGLYFSKDKAVWTPMSRGFTTYQAYNVAANYLGHVAGGSQDNGTQFINFTGNSVDGQPSKNALEIYGGDGFDVEFSRFAPKTIFVSTYYGQVARTANAGQSSSTFFDDRINGNVATDFNTTFTLWEKSEKQSMLFLAKDYDVWVAMNPTDFANPVDWFLVAQGLGNDRIVEMDHTPDGNNLFIAKYQKVFRVDSLQAAVYDNGSAVRAIPAPIKTVDITPAGANGRVVTSVNVDMTNANHVVITLGGYGNSTYVYETDNALAPVPTWKHITGNLPSMPVYDAVIDVDDPNRIIIATDLGIWLTENGGTTWEEANNGMARVPVYEIRAYEYNPWEGMVMYLGTHGRGYYRSNSLLTSTKKITKDATALKAYPNPAKDKIQISFVALASGKATVEIYGMNGTKYGTTVVSANRGNNSADINTSGYANGYYFARVVQGSETSTVKFMVQH